MRVSQDHNQSMRKYQPTMVDGKSRSAADPPWSAADLSEGQCSAVNYGGSTAGKITFSESLRRPRPPL
ncbi:MAG: hypothetical protein FJY65_04365 [Calditrichaeota bacterium]|nr:hypothetical protein [Calditrichota bacterium]